ncbi:TPA: rhamnulose-1-phosphate aldolase, partial [Streptococcus agalactiae]
KAANIALKLRSTSGKSIQDNNILTTDDLEKVCQKLQVKGRYLL